MSAGPSQAIREAVAAHVDCLRKLQADLEAVEARFVEVGRLVALVAKMVDGRDEQFVILVLGQAATIFPKQLEENRHLINQTMRRCVSDVMVATKGQEILLIYGDAASLVEFGSQENQHKFAPMTRAQIASGGRGLLKAYAARSMLTL